MLPPLLGVEVVGVSGRKGSVFIYEVRGQQADSVTIFHTHKGVDRQVRLEPVACRHVRQPVIDVTAQGLFREHVGEVAKEMPVREVRHVADRCSHWNRPEMPPDRCLGKYRIVGRRHAVADVGIQGPRALCDTIGDADRKILERAVVITVVPETLVRRYEIDPVRIVGIVRITAPRHLRIESFAHVGE